MNTLMVVVDHSQGKVPPVSWDALSMGQQFAAETGASITALLLGSQMEPVAGLVRQKDVSEVLLVENPCLARYDPDFHCEALRQIISAENPECLIFPHTYQNLDLCPRLSASLGVALASDCVGFRMEEGLPLLVRSMFRGKVQAEVRIRSTFPWLISVQAGAYAGEARTGDAPVRTCSVDLSGVNPRRRQLEVIQGSKGTVDLSKAERVVAVGRGIGKRENLSHVEALAEALGAEIGASRPVVDNEWLARERQIGSSGQSVAARLYIACGISGAIQHVVGMKNSECIVAINSDPNAPIFGVADYGIIGDLAEVLPALTEKLLEEKQK